MHRIQAFFRKYRTIFETLFLLVILAGGCLWKYQEFQLQRTQQELAEKILRFHVLANSDSRTDQVLKLKVRDAVGAFMQPKLSAVTDREQCSRIVRNHLRQIEAVAERTLRQEGYTYPVSARIGTVDFPQKTYGNYTFPAGDYEALNLMIGSGKGRNWWCVMYPNMCFHGAVYEVVDEDAKKSLKKVLSEDAYDAVLKSGKYRVRFKYLDFLNRWLK